MKTMIYNTVGSCFRKTLLAIFSLVSTLLANASEWVPPTPKTVELTYGTQLYFYNEGSQQFLTRGNAWGAQMSLGETGLPVIVKERETQYTDGGTYVMLYNAKDKAYFDQDSNGDQCWVDRSEADALKSENAIWKLKKNADGTFQFGVPDQSKVCNNILFDPEDPSWNAALWAGWNETPGNTEVYPCVDTEVCNASSVRWLAVSEVDYQAFIPTFSLRTALYKMLVKADDMEVTVPADVATAYNNATATPDELQAAINTLSNSLLKMELEQKGEVDVTAQYITNPNFDNENAGWNFTTGLSWWNTDNFHYRAETCINDAEGVKIDGFICRYVWSGEWIGNVNNDEASQTFTLPAGRYRLEADCVGLQEGDGSGSYGSPQDWTGKIKGFYLFAKTALGETRTAVETDGKTPRHYTVEFISAGGEATVGLKVDDAFGSFFGGDNFRLYCTSIIDSPNAVELMSMMDKMQKYLENYEYAPFSQATYDRAEAYATSCEDALDKNDDDTYIAFIADGRTLATLIDTEIAAYKKLSTIVTDATEAMSQARYEDLGDEAVGTLEQCLSETATHLYDADVTATQALALVDNWKTTLVHLIALNVNEVGDGYDVTCLLDNGDFKKGTEWYNGNGSQRCEGWNGPRPWAYMPGSDAADGIVEFSDQDFDFYQELHNMPAGVYTLQFRGMYRWGSKEEAVASMGTAEEIEHNVARFYLNDTEIPFKTITEDAFALDEDEEAGGGNYATGKVDAEGHALFIPDANWYYVWRHRDCHLNVGAAVVGEDGVLRIGFKAQSGKQNRWALISAPTLRYEGNTDAAYAAAYALLGNALVEKRDRAYASHPMSKELYNTPETAIAAAEAVVQNGSATERKDMLATLAAKRSEISLWLAVTGNLAATCEYYNHNRLADKSSADFEQALTTMQESLKGACQPWDTNAEMAAAEHALNALFTIGVQAKGKDATEENPYDMSVVVRNADFFDMMENEACSKYWNTTDGTASYGVYSISADAFDINQTVVALPKGFYRLKVQGFEQTTQESATASLYAGVEGRACSTTLVTLPHDNETPWDAESAAREFDRGMFAGNCIDFEVKGEIADVLIGVKKPAGTEHGWTAITHFQLFYLGQSAPNAVSTTSATAPTNTVYNLGGQRITAPLRGINIIVTRRADGTMSTQKMLVK